MPLQNIFLQHAEPHPDGISIHGRDFHYVKNVRRARVGDRFTAVTGGRVYQLRVASVQDGYMICAVESARTARDRLSPEIFVYQGMLKSAKMDLVVSRLSELGVHALTPLVTERTVARGVPGAVRMERWRNLAAEGAKVSGVERAMHLTGPAGFEEAAGRLAAAERGLPAGRGGGPEDTRDAAPDAVVMIFCVPAAHSRAEGVRPVLESLRSRPSRFHLLFGPEGGFTTREVERVIRMGGRAVTMGALIFRSETAAVLGAGFVRVFYGQEPPGGEKPSSGGPPRGDHVT